MPGEEESEFVPVDPRLGNALLRLRLTLTGLEVVVVTHSSNINFLLN